MNKKNIFKNFIYKVDIFWINIAVVFAILIICAGNMLFAKKYVALTICLIALVVLAVIDALLVIIRRKNAKKRAEILGIIDANGNVCTGLIGNFRLPAFIITENCKFLWSNDEFNTLCKDVERKAGQVAGGIFKQHIENQISLDNTQHQCVIKLGKRFYRLYATYVSTADIFENDSQAICCYLVDVSGVERLKNLYKNRRIVVGEIIIDNYDEIFQANGEAVASQVLAQVNNIFNEWLKEKNAIVRSLIRERYIFICENESLEKIKSERFSILEKAKAIAVGNTIPVTLSIGVSTNNGNLTDEAFTALISGNLTDEAYEKAFTDTLMTHLENSEGLINLCLNRGGDQAIVQNSERTNENLFFGGSEIDQPRENMVQVRVTAELLKKSICEAENVMIMGHKFADLDALGSALAIYRIATKLGKPAYVILEGPNSQIDVAYEYIRSSGRYAGVIISQSEALNVMSDGTLVVVVDTFSKSQSEAPLVIDAASKVGVIDHHRRGVDFIEKTVFNYTETLASSTSELLVEMLWYIFPNENVLETIEAETLYGGILVDTKNFYFKTGKRTFEVCGYLRESGVVPLETRKFVQPDFEDYLKINKIVGGMDVIPMDYKAKRCGIAFAECEMSADEANKLASIAADKMLEFNGVECSFVLVKIGNNVSIKARSPGDINVQTVMENQAISGGGHLTAAAGFVKNSTPKEVKSLILRILRENA